MTSTAEKVELLEAELRANQGFSERTGVPPSLLTYAGVWTVVNVVWALYLIVFAPRIATEKQEDGSRQFTYARVGKWTFAVGIITGIVLYLWFCYQNPPKFIVI